MTMDTGSDWEPSVARPGNPLRRFNGRLIDMPWRDGQAEGSGRKFRIIQFNFTELEVLEAVEVYPFPVTQIDIAYKDPGVSQGGTKWAVFSASVRRLLGEEASVKTLVGKMQQWALLPGIVRTRNEETDTWGDTEQPCWQVVSVEGVGETTSNVDVDEKLLALLQGKTETEFNEAALAEAWVRADSALVDQLVNRKLLPRLEAEGKASKNEAGVWSQAAGAA